MEELFSIKEAAVWASNYLGKNVTESNISYLLNYGRIKKRGVNGFTKVSKQELKSYYQSYYGKKEISWKNQLGDDLNWRLSFDYLKEKDTTKHIHRLHPYKGKFIPQLVEYFLDDHTDEFKKETYFKKGDIILDPFCGSGTTLVQANELGMHAIGVDVSFFNSFISNCKIAKYDLFKIRAKLKEITNGLYQYLGYTQIPDFEKELLNELAAFNEKYFPSPEFKRKVNRKEINEKKYTKEREVEFDNLYDSLIDKYKIDLISNINSESFLEKWFMPHIKEEMDYVLSKINNIQDKNTQNIIKLILSRTIRSCRATTHADLATLKQPVLKTYYCRKHGKICKPLFTMINWWERYSEDTLNRLYTYKKLKSDTYQICLTGDARKINLQDKLKKYYDNLHYLIKNQGINGIFTSPPYVGLIDYHEQHAYAYELFGFKRNDVDEIGPLYKGSGRQAREEYVESISQVFRNAKPYLAKDFNIFIVANDKFNLYPTIAKNAGLKIVNKYKRPVLNRTEKDKGAYSEIIFHLKGV